MQASGISGRLLSAGREAALLGRWQLQTTGGGASVTAALAAFDEFLLEHGGRFTLVLAVGPRVWRWRNAQVIARSETTIGITGEGRPEE
ncbi:MAG: hypothetical protein WC683_07995 [bacterium]